MTVSVAGIVESLRTDTSDPMTWSHNTGTTSPEGVVVMLVHGTESTDLVSSVTYGGVAMTRIQSNTDTATEAGRTYIYFLGSGVPTGTQTVSVDLTSGTTTDIFGISYTLDGAGNLEVVGRGGINENAANPSVTLGYGGRTCMAFSVLYSGLTDQTGITTGANCTKDSTTDLSGNFTCAVEHQTTAGSADFAIGWTSSTDDVAYSAISVSEKAWPVPNVNDAVTAAESVSIPINIPTRFDSVTAAEFIHIPLNIPTAFDAVTIWQESVAVEPFVPISVTDFASLSLVGAVGNLSVDTFDSITVSELIVIGVLVNQADSVSVTEAATINAKLMPNVSDSVTAADATAVAICVSLNDSVTITESIQINALLMPNIADAITVTEFVTIALRINLSDSITLTESVTLNAVLMPQVSDSVSLAEFIHVPLNLPTQFDAVTLTESITISLGAFSALVVDISDAVTLTELTVLTVKLTLFDTITISESVTISGLGQYAINISDDISVNEAIALVLPRLFVTASDTIGLAEFVNFTVNLVQADTVGVADAFALQFNKMLVNADEAITVAESVATSFIQTVSISVFDTVFLLTAPPIDIFRFDTVTTDENTAILGPLMWSSIGSLGSAGSKTANQASLNLVTTANLEAGRVAVVLIAVDNNQTTDGDENAVTSVVDSAGNTYTKAREFTNGQAAAQGGATVSVWYSKATTQLNSGQQITANFANATSRDASAITAWKFDLAIPGAISVAGSTTLANDAADPGSMNLALSNVEYLWVRATAHERPSTDTFTKTVAYQGTFDKNGTTGGTAATNMTVAGEWDIAIGASNASDPAWSTGADEAGVLVAFLLTPSVAPNVNEALAVNEAITLLLPTLPLSVGEDVSVQELPIIAIAGVANLAIDTGDSAALADFSAVAIRQLFINQSDSVTVADSPSIQIGAVQFIAVQTGENIAVVENIPMRVNLNVNVNDIVRLFQTDPALITVADILTITDFAQAVGATTTGLSISAFENVVVNIPEIHPVDSVTLSESVSIIGTGQEWFSIGSVGSSFSKSADQSSLVLQVQNAAAVGTVVVLMVAADNAATSDGDEGAVTGIVDQSGNTWQKIGEFTNANAAAQAGATISAWFAQLSAQLDVNELVTVSFSNPTLRDASALTAWNFGLRASGNVVIAAVTTRADDTADPGSMNLALPLGEALWIRGTAHEGPLADTFVKTIAYDATFDKQGTSGGVNNTNMTIAAEFRIFYGTSNPSDPSWTVAADEAGIMFALKLSASLAANVADSLAVGELTTILLPVLKLSVNEPVTITDFASAQLPVAITLALSDGISAADFAALSGSLSLAQTDAITAADAVTLSVAALPFVFDAVSTTDAVTPLLAQLTPSVLEPVTILDTSAALLVGTAPAIAAGEDVILSEFAFAALARLTVNTSDSIAALEAVTIAPSLAIVGNEPITVADASAVVTAQLPPGTFAESVSVVDTIDLRLARLTMLAQDDVTLAEVMAGKLSIRIDQADTITLADFDVAAFNVITIFIEQGDTVSTLEDIPTYLSIYLATGEDIAVAEFSDIFSRIIVIDQQFETVLLSDFSAILYNTFNGIGADDISAVDFVTAAFFPPLVVQEVMLSGKVSGDIILSGKLDLEVKV